MPRPHVPGRTKRGPVPREAGRTASALSLRYAAPQLLHRRPGAAIDLRLRVYGHRLLVYARRRVVRELALSALVDALGAAPLLSGTLAAITVRLAGSFSSSLPRNCTDQANNKSLVRNQR